MRMIDVINAPWAITPEMLAEINAIYDRHVRGESIDIAALEAQAGRPFNSEPKGYTIEPGGVALLQIDGVLAKRMNLLSRISGGTSTALIGRDFSDAMADPAVRGVVLAIDSPGGTVDGTPELGDLIFGARGTKPIIAYSDGAMASAAYWFGSAADEIMISSEVVSVGSIGVVTQHVDMSAAEEKRGIKTTEIYAGKYKRLATQYAPLSAEGKAYIQGMVDHAYSVFVDHVARNRSTTAEDVLARMADGRVFSGSQAIDAGLVDSVGTLSAAIDRARSLSGPKIYKMGGVAQASEENMDLKTLKEKHPDLVAEITQEAQAEMQTKITEATAEGKKLGAQAERERIADVRAQSLPGHEALIAQLELDGASTGADAAKAIVVAEKQLRQQAGQQMQQQANQPVPPADGSQQGQQTIKREGFGKLPAAQQAQLAKSGVTIID